ncbi:MtrB/PioB family decaheme-associated outer membrane protein [Shewanella algae]|uniref:MtrB/PioB family decaheme-associated outer membrane protein n=1 Tax=Shewanella algae TaxID=38313 RepID=UPI000B8B51C1|nr:MtrB/PioB family decaheme-associated outer membrane protein [Shewanella algae]OXS00114.1 hypothetical protein AMR44_14855 [Shewanella algae]
MVIEKQTQMKLSLLALTIACALQPAWAGGYSLQQANRAELKQDKWSCGQCKLPQESRGTLEAGVAYNDGDNAVFANSSGTDADGATGHLGGDVVFYGEQGYRTHIEADKLGYDTGSASLSTGRPGQFDIRLGYRALANFGPDNGMSPYINQDNRLMLPDNWQAAALTSQMPGLDDSLTSQRLEMKRDRFTLDAHYLGSFYKAGLNYRHEQRDGTRQTNGNFLTNSMALATRVDDSTDELEAKLYFKGKGWLAGFNSTLSQYSNDYQALYWENAFFPTFGAAYNGQLADNPDNKALRVGADLQLSEAGHQILMHTAFTRMTQDQALLPATINGPSPQLPAIDGDMQVDVLELKLKYAARLGRGLSVRAGYDYRDRENKTQFKDWPQVSSDSWHQGSATPAAYDHTRQRADIAFNYRFTRVLSLDAGYEYEHHSYSDLARESLFQSSVFAKLNLRASRDWQLWFKGELSERSGGSYQASELSQSPNNPWMRQYWLADRKQTLLRLQNDYRFSDALSFSMALNHKQQDYDETLVGLDEVNSWGYGLSGNYQFSAQFGLNAWLNQDWQDTDQTGSASFGPSGWYSRASDSSTVAGFGIYYNELLDKQLDLGFDWQYSKGESDTDVSQGLTLDYGDYYSRRHTFNAFAKYHFSDKMALRLDWLFEHYQDSDWLNQGLTPDSIPNVLSFGDLGQDYNAHYLGLTLSYSL